ncbi:hypothetical protein VP01_348g12 [Puccinia sorghi]|uniref:Ribosomal eL28/Mak16 domain-containing protein n=1 Tax=Puccinia sorghi TaxID=27349 RepID=A0A0L6UXR7_9BASI|nr:hypothetical protein VP01_348g12 [Puccinia sorghi]
MRTEKRATTDGVTSHERKTQLKSKLSREPKDDSSVFPEGATASKEMKSMKKYFGHHGSEVGQEEKLAVYERTCLVSGVRALGIPAEGSACGIYSGLNSPRFHQMDNAGSADLQWFLLRGWNSKVVQRGGFTFSSEVGNLKNKHSPRYSGLVHPKPMSVTRAPSGGVLITTRKESANPRQLEGTRTTVRVKGNMAGSRRAAGKAAKAAKAYRSDLARAAILRAARIAQTNIRSPKPKSA